MKKHTFLGIIFLLCNSHQTSAVKVSLKKRQLTEIPFADIRMDVTILDLSTNKLTSLGANIFGGHVNIVELNFLYNEIVNVSSLAFNGIINLQKLNLRRNKLTAIPDLQLISNNLIELNLRQNEISSIDTTFEMKALEILTLEENQLTALSVGSLVLPSLKSLDLKYNKLSSIDDATFEALPSLEDLFLTKNSLTEFNPRDLNISATLKKLYLGRNKFSGLAANSFVGLQNLKTFDLSTNKLTEFDINVLTDGQGFPDLHKLYLDGNKLTMMPNLSPSPTELQDFNIGGNSITNVDVNYFMNFTQLKILKLNEMSLVEVPNLGKTMSALETLDLSKNPYFRYSGKLLCKYTFIKDIELE